MKIGVIGSGAMGSGIAQVAAQAGHDVVVFDEQTTALERASANLQSTLSKLVEKGKISSEEAQAVIGRVHFSHSMPTLAGSELVIEAIVEIEVEDMPEGTSEDYEATLEILNETLDPSEDEQDPPLPD